MVSNRELVTAHNRGASILGVCTEIGFLVVFIVTQIVVHVAFLEAIAITC